MDRALEDGDELGFGGGARVVHVPGRTEGSIAVHPPRYGALFTGDAVAGVGRVMPGVFTVDRTRTLESVRRPASLGGVHGVLRAPRPVHGGRGTPR